MHYRVQFISQVAGGSYCALDIHKNIIVYIDEPESYIGPEVATDDHAGLEFLS